MATQGYKKTVSDGAVFSVDASNKLGGNITDSKNIVTPTEVGTFVNGVTVTNNEYVFDGVDDYVDYGRLLSTQITGINVFTVNFWMYSERNTQMIVSFSDVSTVNASWGIWHRNTDAIRISASNGFVATTPNNSAPINEWVNVTCIIDSTVSGGNVQGDIYINGVFSISETQLRSIADNVAYNLHLGKTALSINSFQGNISNTQIYNRALTPTEIQENYNSQKYRFI